MELLVNIPPEQKYPLKIMVIPDAGLFDTIFNLKYFLNFRIK